MTTMVVNIENGANVKSIVSAMRLLKGVAGVKVHRENNNGCIPGLPYTIEERIAAIHKAEDEYAANRFVSSDEMRKKHPRQ